MEGEARSSVAGRIAAWAAPAILLAISAAISYGVLDWREGGSTGIPAAPGRHNLLLEVARRPSLTFGFRNFIADVAWLQAVQVAGEKRFGSTETDRLDVLVNVVIRLDDRFKVPYFLGGLLLGESPRHARRAVELFRRGRAKFPDDWRLPYYEGYTWYFILGSPLEGGNAFQAAASLPDCPPYVSLLAARMLSEGNDPETALSFLGRMIQGESDPARVAVLERRAREVVAERDMRMLERAAAMFRERTGMFPTRLEALVESGILRRLPEEPDGGRYRISGDGIVSSNRTERLKVFKSK